MNFKSNITQALTPITSFVIYDSYSQKNGHKQLVAKHSFELQDDGTYALGTARLMDNAQQATLAETILQNNTVSMGILPENILAQTNNSLIWYVKARKWVMQLNTTKEGIKKYSVPLPAHVISFHKGNIYAFALKQNKRPTAETVLYHSPVPNIYSDGKLCKGSVKFPSSASLKMMDDVEAGIFRTVSSGIHNRGLKGVKRQNHNQFLIDLSTENKKFSVTKLLPTKLTLIDLVH
jgi:PRTRC genetic system protein B